MFVFIIMAVSFIFESIVSNLIPINSFLLPLFTVTSLVIIYPFFNNDNHSFLKSALALGLIYDIVFTNTLFLNMGMFLLVAMVVKRINIILSNNFFNVMLITVVIVTFYLSSTYFILYLIDYKNMNITYLFEMIFKSYLANIIYSLIVYLITDKISKKHRILKID